MKAHSCGYKNSNGCGWRFGLALCAALAMAAAIGMAAPGTAQAEIVLTVRNGSDSGPGSLRRAITVANNNPPARGGIKIDFDLGSSTITLLSPLPEIEHRLTIDGGGNIAISRSSGADLVIFSVASGATLELDNLTIERGNDIFGSGCGGVLNRGTLTVRNSTFSGNSAHRDGGGICNEGTLTVTNSTFSGNSANNGGGIFNSAGTVTVTNSTFSRNSGSGGGIFNSAGTVTVTNSTFSRNFSVGGDGGGICNSAGTVTVTNSTFSGNSTGGGGGISNRGTLTVRNSTFSGNSAGNYGGGIRAYGIPNRDRYDYEKPRTVTVSNSIFSGNTARYGGGNCYGEVPDYGYNIDDDGSCRFTNKTSASGYRGTLFSGGLADNGGPTETIALAPGTSNPAIDAVPTHLCPATDQRGYARRDDHEHFCDIGAYESGATGGELRIESSAGTFELKAAVGFDGPIDPLTQDVTLQIGSYSLRIPAGSFVLQQHGDYRFEGTVNGRVQVWIDPATDTLQAKGTDPELSGITTNPVTVTLTIGTAVSHTSVAASVN